MQLLVVGDAVIVLDIRHGHDVAFARFGVDVAQRGRAVVVGSFIDGERSVESALSCVDIVYAHPQTVDFLGVLVVYGRARGLAHVVQIHREGQRRGQPLAHVDVRSVDIVRSARYGGYADGRCQQRGDSLFVYVCYSSHLSSIVSRYSKSGMSATLVPIGHIV